MHALLLWGSALFVAVVGPAASAQDDDVTVPSNFEGPGGDTQGGSRTRLPIRTSARAPGRGVDAKAVAFRMGGRPALCYPSFVSAVKNSFDWPCGPTCRTRTRNEAPAFTSATARRKSATDETLWRLASTMSEFGVIWASR